MKQVPSRQTRSTQPNNRDEINSPIVSEANEPKHSFCLSQIYPFLLIFSTGIAGLFCFMYITKPFMDTSVDSHIPKTDAVDPIKKRISQNQIVTEKKAVSQKKLNEGPRDAGISEKNIPAPKNYEHTNLKIQHILTAETSSGHFSKLNIEVPVLYEGRNLRWTSSEIANARDLLSKLASYQDRCRILRTEGAELLDSWNQLVEKSIPSSVLRADSPTLPVNQQDLDISPPTTGLKTTESIQIQSTEK